LGNAEAAIELDGATGRLRFVATRCDLFGHGFQSGLRPAGQKKARAFRRELLCDRGSNGASGTEDNGILVLQMASIHGVLHLF
jgi:hypothetical protein